MTVVAPPPHDDPELLIREARARQRKRRVGAAAVLALVAGGAIAAHSISSGPSPVASHAGGGVAVAKAEQACGVRGKGVRILSRSGQTLYREPPPRGRHYVNPDAGFPTIRCSGSTIWAVWFNGAGMSQEAYLGARSLDRGRSWKLVFTEGMFGPWAPHHLDAYLGPWTLVGPRTAYFVGTCPACRGYGTFSLSVTRDAGRTFRRYPVPGSDAYAPESIRVRGQQVAIRERRDLGLRLRWRTVIVHTT
jgi:hypothetical protein